MFTTNFNRTTFIGTQPEFEGHMRCIDFEDASEIFSKITSLGTISGYGGSGMAYPNAGVNDIFEYTDIQK